MQSLLQKSVVKSLLRGLYIAGGTIYSAVSTYASKGHHIGFNNETYLGVGITLVFPITALLHRYFDKNDPMFGKVLDVVSAATVKKLTDLNNKTPNK